VWKYVLKRISAMVPLLIIVSMFVFFLGQYGASDLAMSLTLKVNDNVFDAQIYQEFAEKLNLKDPIFIRFFNFLKGAVRGEFGIAYILPGTPDIGQMIGKALPISMQLAGAALFFVIILGIPMGVAAAVARNSPLDYAIVFVSTVLSSTPGFVLAPMALVILVTQLKILPTVGFGWHGIFAVQTILPALCLAAGPLLAIVRFTRSSVIDVLSNDYIVAARARGLSWPDIILRHVIKNSMIPVMTTLGMATARMLSGSIFIETVFAINGFGGIAVQAFQGGDIQTVAATTLVSGAIVMLMNLLVDILYGALDPRVRIQS